MSSEKLALFIDGENLHHSAKALGFDIDFKRLLTEMRSVDQACPRADETADACRSQLRLFRPRNSSSGFTKPRCFCFHRATGAEAYKSNPFLPGSREGVPSRLFHCSPAAMIDGRLKATLSPGLDCRARLKFYRRSQSRGLADTKFVSHGYARLGALLFAGA
jgi:hypothetical protein